MLESGGVFSGTFDTTNTGTMGSDAALVRAEAVTVSPGVDESFHWKVTFTDENGASKDLGGVIALANLQPYTEIRRFPFKVWAAADGNATHYTTEYVQAVGTTQERFVATIILPIGATLTATRCYAYRNGTGDFVRFVSQYVTDGSAAAGLGTAVDHSTTGWQELEITMSRLIGAGETYSALVLMDADTTASHVRLGYLECEFTVPDFTKN